MLKSNYACGWTTCGQRGLPLTSRYALIYHIRSHTVEPITTPQDLINDIINFGSSMGGISESPPQPPFLFGSELTHRPSQSIWSASRDEQPLLYSGNGSAPGQIYQTLGGISESPEPITTPQDLLNDIINFGSSMGGISEPPPQPPFLFGSELTHRPSQSIWSALRDEQPLLYSGNGGALGQIYQTSPRQFTSAIPPSQDSS